MQSTTFFLHVFSILFLSFLSFSIIKETPTICIIKSFFRNTFAMFSRIATSSSNGRKPQIRERKRRIAKPLTKFNINISKMNYNIIGFGAYMITDERQVIKIAHTPKGQKVSVISPFRPHANSEYEYVRLTKKENGVTTRYTFPIDEIFVSAKLGLELGTPESRSSMKKYRHERELMGRVSSAVGDTLKEQEIVNLLHADLVRQMRNVGLIVDTDNLTVFVVSQILFDYLRICCESSKTPVTQKVITKNGESLQEHPIWQMKRKFFAEVLSGLRSLGLTYERVIKQIPTDIIDDIHTMFEKQEHDDKTKNSGIVWND